MTWYAYLYWKEFTEWQWKNPKVNLTPIESKPGEMDSDSSKDTLNCFIRVSGLKNIDRYIDIK